MGRSITFHCDCCGRENVHLDGIFGGDPAQANDDAYVLVPVYMQSADHLVLCKKNGCDTHFKERFNEFIETSKCKNQKGNSK